MDSKQFIQHTPPFFVDDTRRNGQNNDYRTRQSSDCQPGEERFPVLVPYYLVFCHKKQENRYCAGYEFSVISNSILIFMFLHLGI